MYPVLAGADTTAMIMRAVFYHVLKNPRVYAKLCAEVRSTQQAFVPVSNAQARAMPYLDAVIREALRLNAPVCMALERIVPPEGLRLPDGRFIPGGQIVGMNPYVLARNKRVFGEDAEKFNPDRWLRQDGEDDQQHRKRVKFWWDNAVIAFGGGSRVCIGKHLALMEIYKVVPTLLATFDIELDDPHEVWWTCQRWFYWTRGVVCRLRPRRD
jgi:cytochrome P450